MGRLRLQDLDEYDMAGEEKFYGRKKRLDADDETVKTRGRKLNKRVKK